jgi:isoleucyl-tRNA synthetase
MESHESVHLSDYPTPDNKRYRYIDSALLERMRLAKGIVGLCRAARNDAQIKVRQPLGRIQVAVTPKQKDAVAQLENLILEEVNVQRIEYVDDPKIFLLKKAVPNFRTLGPKFGKNASEVAAMVSNFSEDIIEAIEEKKSYSMEVSGIKGSVSLDDFEIVNESRDGFVVQSDGDISIALDTTLTEELIQEGLVREFINRVQTMRKEAGFDVTDRIKLSYSATPGLSEAIEEHNAHIKSETLAVTVGTPFAKCKFSRSWEFSDQSVQVGIEKIT